MHIISAFVPVHGHVKGGGGWIGVAIFRLYWSLNKAKSSNSKDKKLLGFIELLNASLLLNESYLKNLLPTQPPLTNPIDVLKFWKIRRVICWPPSLLNKPRLQILRFKNFEQFLRRNATTLELGSCVLLIC